VEKIPLAIVGCGVMGKRHLAGYVELQTQGLSPFRLVSVCDLDLTRAEEMAQLASDGLDEKVVPSSSFDDLDKLGVHAVDLVVLPEVHHALALDAFEKGWHVLVEKPMGLTVKACRVMMEAAENRGGLLAVAENFHYDPMNRLGLALLNSDVIGTPRLMIHQCVGGGDGIIVTPWRHLKRSGGPLLDVGVHNAYVTEMFMGPVREVYAQARLHEETRRRTVEGKEEVISPDAEDAAYATLTFESGAVCQFVEDHGGWGQSIRQRTIHGSKGSLSLPGDRTGKPLALHRSGEDVIQDEGILDRVPDFRLDEVTSVLFGGPRPHRYDLPFQETDRKLLALEYADFGKAIQEGKGTQVDLEDALRSVALPYAMLESQKAHRTVTMEEVLSGQIDAYQRELNEMLALAG